MWGCICPWNLGGGKYSLRRSHISEATGFVVTERRVELNQDLDNQMSQYRTIVSTILSDKNRIVD